MATRCSNPKANGTPCRAWAVPGTDPPLCSAHGGRKGGAPKGNQNARKHGAYAADDEPIIDLEQAARMLQKRLRRLDQWLDDNEDTLEPDQRKGLYHLQAQMTSRLGRLSRDLEAAGVASGDKIGRLLDEALDELNELGLWPAKKL